ncbi:hypothetical protein fugu_006860 [Takifugu bimaculatus]|uniref:Ig-like domain-containing protein n=1 Tax=Takifugu bimaculatus TaxID=433685 RepID=A0A4Z2B6R3_9TELE|nr:hypothetical protein fugu_006860 [Takifugu bimaculatus]
MRTFDVATLLPPHPGLETVVRAQTRAGRVQPTLGDPQFPPPVRSGERLKQTRPHVSVFIDDTQLFLDPAASCSVTRRVEKRRKRGRKEAGKDGTARDGTVWAGPSGLEAALVSYMVPNIALVNFTDSLVFGPELEDIYSVAFSEVSEAVVDTLESEYNRIPGTQTVNVVIIKKLVREDGVDVFVELDVGSHSNNDDEQIRSVLYGVVKEGAIASYVTSVQGFQFRRLGEVRPMIRACMADEHRCGDGTCILMEYLCDNRPDCRDMSDEANCEPKPGPPPVLTTPPTTTTTAAKKPLVRPDLAAPCRVDQSTCLSGECIPQDYICDGERDCADGSDELRCGTPSPCEPNEFRCKNGHCALKLWRCDGDNDCEDNSDETGCPTGKPGDHCAPEQFECTSDRTCIPASYQCDEELDCPDHSDEYGCTPPSVTSTPEESVQAARGSTVTFTCQAVGVPMPIITWRLNWGHIPASARISMTSKDGRGTLTIRDVKEADQGAYTCEAINAKGLVFGIPDGVLTLTSTSNPGTERDGGFGNVCGQLLTGLVSPAGNCPEGHFTVEGRCVSCFCAGITKNCKNTGRYRNHVSLRFTAEDDFKGTETPHNAAEKSLKVPDRI